MTVRRTLLIVLGISLLIGCKEAMLEEASASQEQVVEEHRAATTENTTGYRGIPDPTPVIGFDPFADYEIDESFSGSQGRAELSRNGTADDPHVIDATGAVWEHLVLSGSYIILQNGKVEAKGDDRLAAWRCTHCVIRDFEVAGPQLNFGHGAAVGLGKNSMWLRGSIHNFGDRNYQARENDLHGIKAFGPDLWIWEAHIYEVSGDSVQIGDASRGEAQRVYVAGGEFHGNRENCLDIKDSQDIVLSGFLCYEQLNSNDEFGVVIHDDAFRTQVLDATFTNVNYGIVSSGRAGHVIDGNKIEAHRIGIQIRSTQNITITNNTITGKGRCIQRQNNVSGNIQRGCN